MLSVLAASLVLPCPQRPPGNHPPHFSQGLLQAIPGSIEAPSGLRRLSPRPCSDVLHFPRTRRLLLLLLLRQSALRPPATQLLTTTWRRRRRTTTPNRIPQVFLFGRVGAPREVCSSCRSDFKNWTPEPEARSKASVNAAWMLESFKQRVVSLKEVDEDSSCGRGAGCHQAHRRRHASGRRLLLLPTRRRRSRHRFTRHRRPASRSCGRGAGCLQALRRRHASGRRLLLLPTRRRRSPSRAILDLPPTPTSRLGEKPCVVRGRLRTFVERPQGLLPPPLRRHRSSDSTILRDVEKTRVVDEEVQSLLA